MFCKLPVIFVHPLYLHALHRRTTEAHSANRDRASSFPHLWQTKPEGTEQVFQISRESSIIWERILVFLFFLLEASGQAWNNVLAASDFLWNIEQKFST